MKIKKGNNIPIWRFPQEITLKVKILLKKSLVFEKVINAHD